MTEPLGRRPGNAPGQAGWLTAETARLLDFAEGSRDPLGGYGRQDNRGARVQDTPVELWITGRMTHVYALGEQLGHPGAAELVAHGLDAMRGRMRDVRYGGWYPEVGPTGPVRTEKAFYQHAFVVLSSASAVIGGHTGARDLLEEVLQVVERHFWSPDEGMVYETWDESFRELEAYRGVNAAMHGVESFLAAYDAIGAEVWRDRALTMTARVVCDFAASNDWRIPEHFTPDWKSQPDYNRKRPDDPFRPYGSTVGHGLEWSRLCLHLHAALAEKSPRWLVSHARELFERAVSDGWAADGADGFVYTVDWGGKPVVRQRMHWVLAEAISAAATLYTVTGEESDRQRYNTWWNYAESRLLDRELGSWHHELDPSNRPAATVWPGKADAYHAVQATLLPQLPLRASVAAALRDGIDQSR